MVLLACFYTSRSKRVRKLWRKGGNFCFSSRNGVRWVEAMCHELDIVLENILVVLLHNPEYIEIEADCGRRDKADGLLQALLHPLFKLNAAFFADIFAVVGATSKEIQAANGAQMDAVRVLMVVMCTELMHTMSHVIPGGLMLKKKPSSCI